MEFKEFLRGKNIAFVGPSTSNIGTNNGELIDSFDLVVRLNKSLPIPNELESDIGTRTDILYSCMDNVAVSGGIIDPQMYKNAGVKQVRKPVNVHIRSHNTNFTPYDINYSEIDPAFQVKVEGLTKSKPHTGFISLLDLLEQPIKSITLFGVTFFKDMEYVGYSPNNDHTINDINNLRSKSKEFREKYGKDVMYNMHDSEAEYDYFIESMYTDDRVHVDKTLHKILNIE